MSDVRLEEVSRQVELTLRANLPQVLAQIASEMITKDAAYFAAIGESPVVTPLASPSRYFLGHDPLILDRPLEMFPVVTVMCHNHTPAVGGDNYSRIANDCYIEAYVHSENEAICNRMAWRYGKAIHRIVTNSDDFGLGSIESVDTEPVVDTSNAFTRRKSNTDNTTIYVQGTRISFVVNENQATETLDW